MSYKSEDIPEIWKDRHIPSFITRKDEFDIYPDPDMIVYAFSLNKKDIQYSQGFDTEIDGEWNVPVKLSAYCEAAYHNGWIAGCGWAFQDD